MPNCPFGKGKFKGRKCGREVRMGICLGYEQKKEVEEQVLLRPIEI
jgi:hypothetical protein